MNKIYFTRVFKETKDIFTVIYGANPKGFYIRIPEWRFICPAVVIEKLPAKETNKKMFMKAGIKEAYAECIAIYIDKFADARKILHKAGIDVLWKE